MRPIFRVTNIGGGGVSQSFTGPGGRATAIELTDSAGQQLDTVDVYLDDRLDEGVLAIPESESAITVEMGYQETGLFKMGTFYIESVELSGWPRQMKIHAQSGDMNSGLKSQGSHTYNMTTPTKIVEKIARRNHLAPKVSGKVASRFIHHAAQTDESDMHFLTRFAFDHDAVAKISDGQLIFVDKGASISGTGVLLAGGLARYPDNVKSYWCKLNDRNYYQGGATAQHYNPGNGETKTQTSPPPPTRNPLAKGAVAGGIAAAAQVVYKEAKYQQNQTDAKTVATSQAQRDSRRTGWVKVHIIGDPTVLAAQTLTIEQVRPEVDGDWYMTLVRHVINSEGYDTYIEGEYPGLGGGGGMGGYVPTPEGPTTSTAPEGQVNTPTVTDRNQ